MMELSEMNKPCKKIFLNIKKYNGVCHAGTICQDTNYTFKTIRRYLALLEEAKMIENIPCKSTGKECWYTIDQN